MNWNRPFFLRACLLGGACAVATFFATEWRRAERTSPRAEPAHAQSENFVTPQNSSLPPADNPVLQSASSRRPARTNLVREQLAVVLDKAGVLSDSAQQVSELLNLVKQIDFTDIPATLEFLQTRKATRFESELQNLLIRRWAEFDAPTAAGWVEKTLTGSPRANALSGLAAVWTVQDPQAAEVWARQLPLAEERSAALLAVAYELNREDPPRAMAVAVKLPASESRDEFIVQSAGAWATSASKEAVAWARQIQDETLRYRALAAIATGSADDDPAGAATLAAQSLPAGKEQDDAVVGIVQRWVQKEPGKAAAWVAEFPTGMLRDTALETVVKLWADQDLAEAGKWINSITPRANRDVAVAAYVEKVSVQFPEMAAEWAKAIGDEKLRGERMENLAELWLHSNAAAARAWIAQAPLTDDAKSRLLAIRPK